MERKPGTRRVAEAVPSAPTVENSSKRAAVVTAYCARPQCRSEFRRTMGRGRPRNYCSDNCRREAESDARRLAAQLEHHRSMAEMLTRDLATYDIETPAANPSSAGPPNIEIAAARAEGVLIGLDDGSPLATEFRKLLDAVRSSTSVDQEHKAS